MKVTQMVSRDTFDLLFPKFHHFINQSCAEQVLLGEEGTEILFNRIVPAEMVERLQYQSARGDRKPKYVEGGKIMNIASFQGIYKLVPASVFDFEKLLLI
jgi:hypothetical protein